MYFLGLCWWVIGWILEFSEFHQTFCGSSVKYIFNKISYETWEIAQIIIQNASVVIIHEHFQVKCDSRDHSVVRHFLKQDDRTNKLLTPDEYKNSPIINSLSSKYTLFSLDSYVFQRFHRLLWLQQNYCEKMLKNYNAWAEGWSALGRLYNYDK